MRISIKKALLIGALVWPLAAMASDTPADGIEIHVRREDEAVVIDLSTTIAASPQQVWAVLVDFEHMPQFLTNVSSSKIVDKKGDVWTVAQTGRTSHGLFSFAYDTLREVELKPFEAIRSHVIGGSMKKFDGYTQLFPNGASTRLVYHSVSIADVWVPPLVGTAIVGGEVRQQFQQMEAEIMRRKAAAAVVPEKPQTP